MFELLTVLCRCVVCRSCLSRLPDLGRVNLSIVVRRFRKCSSNVVETAKANGLEPYAYLRRLFERLPYAKTVADYESLLPFATFAHS